MRPLSSGPLTPGQSLSGHGCCDGADGRGHVSRAVLRKGFPLVSVLRLGSPLGVRVASLGGLFFAHWLRLACESTCKQPHTHTKFVRPQPTKRDPRFGHPSSVEPSPPLERTPHNLAEPSPRSVESRTTVVQRGPSVAQVNEDLAERHPNLAESNFNLAGRNPRLSNPTDIWSRTPLAA